MGAGTGAQRALSALAAASLALLAALLLAFGDSPAQAQQDTITTTLYPGWNLVGWIEAETDVDAVFQRIPGLVTVHSGSGDGGVAYASRQEGQPPHTLSTLRPGVGYWFRLVADEPLEWRRSAQPAARRFNLQRGPQLVAWTGPSGRTVAEALLGLEGRVTAVWRWVAAERRYLRWPTDLAAGPADAPLLQRGDALGISLTRAGEWLHPTGDLPPIEFAGGLHAALPDDFYATIETDLRFVIEQFAAKFAFEAPAERVRVRITTTAQAAAQQYELLRCGLQGCAHSPPDDTGVSTIVLPSYKWTSHALAPGGSARTFGRIDLAHEYFHILQHELAGVWRALAPGWLIEGTAMWSRHIIFDDQPPSLELLQLGTNELDLASRSYTEDYDHPLGAAAVALLAQRAGSDALVEFWRILGERSEPYLHWSAPFERAFGFSAAEFEREFHELRRPLFSIVNGQTISLVSESLPPLEIEARGFAGAFGAVYRTEVEADRTFTLTLARSMQVGGAPFSYKLTITRGGSRCFADLHADGSVVWSEPANLAPEIMLQPNGATMEDLAVLLPESFCRRELAVTLAGPYGASPNTTVLFCRPQEESCMRPPRGAGGTFRDFVPWQGDYLIRVVDNAARCGAFVSADGFTQQRERASRVMVGETPTVVTVRLDSPAELCTAAGSAG